MTLEEVVAASRVPFETSVFDGTYCAWIRPKSPDRLVMATLDDIFTTAFFGVVAGRDGQFVEIAGAKTALAAAVPGEVAETSTHVLLAVDVGGGGISISLDAAGATVEDAIALANLVLAAIL